MSSVRYTLRTARLWGSSPRCKANQRTRGDTLWTGTSPGRPTLSGADCTRVAFPDTNLQVVVRADVHRPCLVRPGLGLQLSLNAVCPMLHSLGTLLLQLVHLGSGDVVGEEDNGLHRLCKLPAQWHEMCGAWMLCSAWDSQLISWPALKAVHQGLIGRGQLPTAHDKEPAAPWYRPQAALKCCCRQVPTCNAGRHAAHYMVNTAAMTSGIGIT